jgi:hypothetical protein
MHVEDIKISRLHLHIDGGKSTVGDGAADSTSKGESGVKLEPRELGSSRCSRSFHLGSNRSAGRHYDGICVLHTGEKDEEKKIKRDGRKRGEWGRKSKRQWEGLAVWDGKKLKRKRWREEDLKGMAEPWLALTAPNPKTFRVQCGSRPASRLATAKLRSSGQPRTCGNLKPSGTRLSCIKSSCYIIVIAASTIKILLSLNSTGFV